MVKKRNPKGSGCVFLPTKDSKTWWAKWYIDGIEHRESTGTQIRQEALKSLRKKMMESENGLLTSGEQKKLRYGHIRQIVLDHYDALDRKSLKDRADGSTTIDGLAALDGYFGWTPDNPGPSVASITTQTTREFAKTRRENGERRRTVGNASINRSLALLRRMLYLAHQEHKIVFVPKVEMLPEPEARKGFLERPVFVRLLAALPGHLQALIAHLYYSGMRLNEALGLEWSQYDKGIGKHGAFNLEPKQTKTRNPRMVPIHSDVAALLTPKKEGAVFDGTNLRASWEAACAAVGLGTRERVEYRMPPSPGRPKGRAACFYRYRGLLVHDLRRSAIRNLRRAGVPEGVAMKISGHKTRSVFERYNIVDSRDTVEAIEAVENYGKGDKVKLSSKPPRKQPAKWTKTA